VLPRTFLLLEMLVELGPNVFPRIATLKQFATQAHNHRVLCRQVVVERISRTVRNDRPGELLRGALYGFT
jgi:hypothetical protein